MNPQDAAFNAREVVVLSQLPGWVLGVAAVALLGAVLLGARATRGAPTSVRIGLLTLRVLLCAGVVALLLEPGLRLMATSREPNRVVVAVDASASMATDEDGQTRARRAAAAARDILADLAARPEPFAPELWWFDGEARRAAPDELERMAAGTLAPEGKVSRLGAALGAVPKDEGAPPLGGVVLISDGADTSGLSPALTPELREALTRLGAPVHTVAVGAAARFKDLALERVVADELAFVRNKLTIDVNVRSKGFNTTVPLTLKEDGRPVATTEVKVADGQSVKASFTFEPQRAGKRVYTITAPVLADESIAENNRVDFTLKLIRDRIRVLLVAGRPSWDERHVRKLLKENPSVDLISFFILRSTTDLTNAGNRELSLIPFPTRELFTEELGTFDVVIFQDFNYRPYQMAPYLQNVKEFVEETGGGFMMIGGELSFSEGDYEGTPVADVLPVQLLAGTGHLSTETFSPLLTDAGRSHPITELGELSGGDGQGSLAALPPLEGVNLVASVKEGADVLLAHPFLNVGAQPAPVVVVSEIGKGRSMAVLTDSTWVWGLPHVGAGGRGDAHRRFFANALRWLIRDPELSRARIVVDLPDATRGVEPGVAVPLEVRTFNSRYQPEGGDSVKLTLTPLDAADGSPPTVLEGVTGEDGSFHTTFLPPTPGVWRARVDASAGPVGAQKAIGADEDAFVVRATAAEKLFSEPRPDVLAAVAAAGGGRAVLADEARGLPFVDREVQRVHRQRTEPLWNRLWVLGALGALAGAEWWWRRRRGFA